MVKKIYTKMVLLVSVPVLLNGCSSGNIIVQEPFREHYTAKTINVVGDNATTKVPLEYQNYFEEKLKDQLIRGHKFDSGNDLTIRYRFLQCDERDRFTRWFLGGIGNAGEGSLMVEAKFYNPMGVEIGKVTTEGKIRAGVGGGSFNNALKRAADNLANYVAQNFKS